MSKLYLVTRPDEKVFDDEGNFVQEIPGIAGAIRVDSDGIIFKASPFLRERLGLRFGAVARELRAGGFIVETNQERKNRLRKKRVNFTSKGGRK